MSTPLDRSPASGSEAVGGAGFRPRRRFVWQLFPTYLIVALVPLIAVTWYTTWSLKSFFLMHAEGDLMARARLFTESVGPALEAGEYTAVNQLCRDLGTLTGTRFSVILPGGDVVGDSMHDPGSVGSQAGKPEFVAVLGTGRPTTLRRTSVETGDSLFVAVPVRQDDTVAAVVRAAYPVSVIEQPFGEVRSNIMLMGLAMALLAAITSLVVSRRISSPLVQMRKGAERFAQGRLDWRLPVPRTEEIGAVALAFNDMAGQLSQRLRDVVRQRNELAAVLSSMAEGVFAVDNNQQIISMNQAGARMLHCDPEACRGRAIQEVARNTELQRFVARSLESDGVTEAELGFHDIAGDRYFHARGALLQDVGGDTVGAVIVLNDVTRLHRLEEVRRDFVANVSHELKTPVTAITGFIETMADGAARDPEASARFLGIMERHARRLGAIIEDLLALSRLEQESGGDGMEMQVQPLCMVLERAVQTCGEMAAEKDITVRLRCDEGVAARVHPSLMEQAVVNLLANAVTYSDQGGAVEIEASNRVDHVAVTVRDRGRGIAQRHLDRIFERFYRVDPARSREHGGTGLGLAIVKHIAQAHGGWVSVDSELGRGSTFGIHLPRP